MRTILGGMVLALIMLSFSVQAETIVKDSNSELGRYWLKKAVNPMVVEGKELPTYVVHYDNLSKPVYIGVLESKGCKTFMVKSDDFEVAYACRNGMFGINYMPEQLATLPVQESKAKVNRVNFLKQRIITRKKCNEKRHLGLIASYLPEVMPETELLATH